MDTSGPMDFSVLNEALRSAAPETVRQAMVHFLAIARHLGLSLEAWARPDAAAIIYRAWERASAEARAATLLEFAQAARVLGRPQVAEVLEGGALALRTVGAAVRVGRA